MAASLAERVQHRVQGFLQRMIGFPAGLPQGRPVERDNPLTVGAIPLRGEAPGDYQHTGTTVRVRGFERHPVVMACVRAIVDIASAIDLEAYRMVPSEGEGDREVVETLPAFAPLSRILETPSPFLSPISSALRRVMTDSMTFSPTRTVTCTSTSPT